MIEENKSEPSGRLSKFRDAWKHRALILEGVKNSIFLKKEIERLSKSRMEICSNCPNQDVTGETCLVSGTQPCCKLCGCSLHFKTRSPSSSCDINKWEAIMSQEEEDQLPLND